LAVVSAWARNRPDAETHDVIIDAQRLALAIAFPEDLVDSSVATDVDCYARFDTNGIAVRVDVTTPDNTFAALVREALRRTAFAPAMLRGAATVGLAHLRVMFWTQRGDDEKNHGRVEVKIVETLANPWLLLPELAPKPGDQSGAASAGGPDPYTLQPMEIEPTYDEQELMKRVQYPTPAARAGIHGMVIVRVLADRNGQMAGAIIDKPGHVLLEIAAVNAIRQCMFTPGRQNGQPIPVWFQIPINFTLD
jgi:TonB family protein